MQANDPSSLGWDPAPKEVEPAEVAVRRQRQDGDQTIVNRHIAPPMGFDPSVDVRPSRGIFLGDSGALSYCNTGKNAKGKDLRQMLITGEQLAHPWGHATMHSGSGWKASDFIVAVKACTVEYDRYKTPDGDGIYLFPTDMPFVILDNLNA
eukprot:12939811-Heterocapsa_arctica.AAC.1